MTHLLPVTEIYPELIQALKKFSMVFLQAPPGAGKSTWLPLQLIRDGHFNHIVMLEPRRLAARNIATYLARLQNEKLGESIGLRIRQEKFVSRQTKLEIVTEAMLTRMLQSDPELEGIDCIISDEFHERSIAADTALAFALETQSTLRDDLKILVMSATLDTQKMQAVFDCPVITSQGRSYPVEEIYSFLSDETRWLDSIAPLIKRAIREQPGSALVFLPGKREIDYVARSLSDLDSSTHVVALYGDQTKETQQMAIAPTINGDRKIVLATNIAETSLTIEGIRIVIDSGKKRAAKFNLNTGVTELKTVNISMASAIQRAGRAGRIEPGVVYRLGSVERFRRREKHDTPEILSSDVSTFLLEAKLWGTAIHDLTLLDRPTNAQLQQANALLLMLGALNSEGDITEHGKKLSALGTDIRWAHMLIKAKTLEEQCPGITLLSVNMVALFDSRVGKEAELGARLQAQLTRPHTLYTKQLKFWLLKLGIKPTQQISAEHLSILVALAYPDRIAKRRGEGWLLANGAGVHSRDNIWQKDAYIAIAELGGKNGTHIYSAVPLDIQNIQNVLPELFSSHDMCDFDETTGRFIYEEQLLLGKIVIKKKPVQKPISEAARLHAWHSLIKKRGLKIFNFSHSGIDSSNSHQFFQLLTRMQLAYKHFPDEFPEISEAALVKEISDWLGPYLFDVHNLDQLKKVDVYEALTNILDWPQQSSLDKLFPKRLHVPSGSNVAIDYQLDAPAKLSVRMQEVYGLASTPVLCKGKVSLLIDLLSPARRSLQLTQDLAGFWRGSYHEIKKEMKGRYPKHFWPDNPQDAKATTKTKAKM